MSSTFSTPRRPDFPPVLMSLKRVARTLAVSEKTLRRWVAKGDFPPGLRVGRCWRWSTTTVERWLAEREGVQ